MKRSNYQSALALYQVELKIDWYRIIEYQVKNLKNGINKTGISDLIILKNFLDNNLPLYTLDNHFKQMQKLFNLQLFE